MSKSISDNELAELKEFVENVFEVAFGDDAINRDFTASEVLARLREFSDAALVSEKPAGYTGVTDDENKGVPLSQEEIDTLLTDKIGGMYND